MHQNQDCDDDQFLQEVHRNLFYNKDLDARDGGDIERLVLAFVLGEQPEATVVPNQVARRRLVRLDLAVRVALVDELDRLAELEGVEDGLDVIADQLASKDTMCKLQGDI